MTIKHLNSTHKYNGIAHVHSPSVRCRHSGSYGRMGEVIENNRTFVLPNESYPYSFKMQYTYDSWNRVQAITYPDGEVVRYEYNTGGMLNKVYGKVVVSNFVVIKGATPGIKDPIKPPLPSTTYTYNYIDSIRYNEFELKSEQWYGNGTKSQYTYDILQRLHTLQLRNASNVLLQNITYTYDRVGNITHIQNTAGTVSGLGGIYNYAYTYDSLYRLTYAAGTATGASYTQSTGFQADGRITFRTNTTQIGTGLPGLSQTVYTYNSDHQPHTILSAGRLKNPTTYLWDANGNMIKQGSNTTLQWDEENRLMTYSKIGLGACYFYDANGERFYKNVGNKDDLLINGSYLMGTPYYDSPVLYASPYVVATEDGYTKHYFIESERFASRIGDGKITNISSHATTSAVLASKQATVNNAAPDSIVPNKFTFLRSLPAHWSTHHTTFWQHSDHLGSASWITDTNGLGYQHLQYKAWGDPFINQRVAGANYEARFTFSGKERDEESGFCYFGARPYNPALSLWLSVDPLSDKYPNLSPYVYCANNPVKYFDPNGKEIGWIDDGNGTVFWDKNTNSEEEFSQNYAGRSGFSYASDANNPSSYTLPNGDGQLIMSEWIEYGTENGKVGPSISMSFIPSRHDNACGWVQTFSSNVPDIPDGDVCAQLPLNHMEERFDFQTIDKNSNYRYWWKSAGPTLLEDTPTRCLNRESPYSIKWMAQSSVIIDGKRSCTIQWGFNITSENHTSYISPRIIQSPSVFHTNAIKYMQ